LKGSILVFYVIGFVLAVPSWWLIHHVRGVLASNDDHGRTTLVINVHSALQHLGLVGERPYFEVKAERTSARESQEPGIVCHFNYAVTIVENGKTAAEFTWRESLHNGATS
jgi:hypothetical protein